MAAHVCLVLKSNIPKRRAFKEDHLAPGSPLPWTALVLWFLFACKQGHILVPFPWIRRFPQLAFSGPASGTSAHKLTDTVAPCTRRDLALADRSLSAHRPPPPPAPLGGQQPAEGRAPVLFQAPASRTELTPSVRNFGFSCKMSTDEVSNWVLVYKVKERVSDRHYFPTTATGSSGGRAAVDPRPWPAVSFLGTGMQNWDCQEDRTT